MSLNTFPLHSAAPQPELYLQQTILPARSGAQGREKPSAKHPTEPAPHQLLIISNEGVLPEAVAKQRGLCVMRWEL